MFCAARSWLLASHGANVVAGCPHHTPRAAAAISRTAGWRHPRTLALSWLSAPRALLRGGSVKPLGAHGAGKSPGTARRGKRCASSPRLRKPASRSCSAASGSATHRLPRLASGSVIGCAMCAQRLALPRAPQQGPRRYRIRVTRAGVPPACSPCACCQQLCGVCGATVFGSSRHGMPATIGRAAQTLRDASSCRLQPQARTYPLSRRQHRRIRLRRPVRPPARPEAARRARCRPRSCWSPTRAARARPRASGPSPRPRSTSASDTRRRP